MLAITFFDLELAFDDQMPEKPTENTAEHKATYGKLVRANEVSIKIILNYISRIIRGSIGKN